MTTTKLTAVATMVAALATFAASAAAQDARTQPREWLNGSTQASGWCWQRNDAVRPFGFWKACGDSANASARAPQATIVPVGGQFAQPQSARPMEWYNGPMRASARGENMCWQRNDAVRPFGYWKPCA